MHKLSGTDTSEITKPSSESTLDHGSKLEQSEHLRKASSTVYCNIRRCHSTDDLDGLSHEVDFSKAADVPCVLLAQNDNTLKRCRFDVKNNEVKNILSFQKECDTENHQIGEIDKKDVNNDTITNTEKLVLYEDKEGMVCGKGVAERNPIGDCPRNPNWKNQQSRINETPQVLLSPSPNDIKIKYGNCYYHRIPASSMARERNQNMPPHIQIVDDAVLRCDTASQETPVFMVSSFGTTKNTNDSCTNNLIGFTNGPGIDEKCCTPEECCLPRQTFTKINTIIFLCKRAANKKNMRRKNQKKKVNKDGRASSNKKMNQNNSYSLMENK